MGGLQFDSNIWIGLNTSILVHSRFHSNYVFTLLYVFIETRADVDHAHDSCWKPVPHILMM